MRINGVRQRMRQASIIYVSCLLSEFCADYLLEKYAGICTVTDYDFGGVYTFLSDSERTQRSWRGSIITISYTQYTEYINNIMYVMRIYDDFEVMFYTPHGVKKHPLDAFGTEYGTTGDLDENINAIKVFRKMLSVLIGHVKSTRLNYFWFGCTERRSRLYKMFAKKVAKKLDYNVVTSEDECKFYFSKPIAQV
jgi:hypothetical protein